LLPCSVELFGGPPPLLNRPRVCGRFRTSEIDIIPLTIPVRNRIFSHLVIHLPFCPTFRPQAVRGLSLPIASHSLNRNLFFFFQRKLLSSSGRANYPPRPSPQSCSLMDLLFLSLGHCLGSVDCSAHSTKPHLTERMNCFD